MNEVLREHGYAPFPQREVQSMVGDGLQALLSRGFAARGADATEIAAALPRFLSLYEANAANLSCPYPGVTETLVELRRRGYRTRRGQRPAENASSLQRCPAAATFGNNLCVGS